MDRRELLEDSETSIAVAIRDHQVRIWTGLPGIIQKFDAERMVCDVQPAIKGLMIDEKGNGKWIEMPLLQDCPVIFPMGGKTLSTYPITKGDECFIHISNRCIDAWWQNGGIQPQMEVRIHNLSDGFVHVGCWSKPNWIKNISTKTAQFRSDDGKTYVEIDPDNHTVNIVTEDGNVNVKVKNGDATVSVEDGDCTTNVTGGDITAKTDQDITATADGNITQKCETYTINATTFIVNGEVHLGGSGGSSVARVGDRDSNNDTIVSGSGKVFAT